MKQLVDSILNKPEYFLSENIETGKTPSFLVYSARGNNKETLNLYIDYKTSKRFINRYIFSLGYWSDITLDQAKDIENLAVETLRSLNIEAIRVKDTYQSEGIK